MSSIATRTAYGKALAEVILEHENVVVLDADLTKSTKTIDAKQACPSRHFNMGIAEGNMMGVAAGLAASGKVVFASSFAMFAAGRAYEQIRNSIAYPNLNVKICATHAGISVGEDGASHQAIEDLALMRVIPNMKVFQPCDAIETRAIIKALPAIAGPCYVRLGRGDVEIVNSEDYTFTMGKGVVLQEGSQIVIVASGLMVQEVLKANTMWKDMRPTIVNMPSIKPIDKDLLIHLANTHEIIISVEEHSILGGLGSAIAEVLAQAAPCHQIMLGMQDCFGQSGTPQDVLAYYHLDAVSLAKQIAAIQERL